MEDDESKTLSVITQHNDMFRTSFGKCKDLKGQIVQTQGVAALGPVATMIIAEKIMRYDNFTEDNDPYGEHEFGSVIIHDNGVPITVWWKIDLYDANYERGAEDPEDTARTARVMTISLPSEH
jgi:hypothetical protein